MAEDDRYSDVDLPLQRNPGEITPEALVRLHALVVEAVADRAAFARWFGAYTSLPKYADADWRPEVPIGLPAVQARVADGREISLNPASRFAFIRQGEQSVCLFVDGQSFDCAGEAAALAMQICAGGTLIVDPGLAASVPALSLLAALVDQGSLAFAEAD